MTTSDKGFDLIRKHEGLRLKSYRCPAGVITIGYGHTRNVRDGEEISIAKAEELLHDDVAVVEKELNASIKSANVFLRQGQFDALVSFAFNLGMGNLLKSTLWRLIRRNPDDAGIPEQFRRWIYSGSRKLPGLVLRREDEIKLYLS